MKKHAFTLVEMLVVISIMALLVALLLPSLTQARELAKRTACLSNMRQVNTSMQIMATDHKGWLNGHGQPVYQDPGDPTKYNYPYPFFVDAIGPYLKDKDTLLSIGPKNKGCPSRTGTYWGAFGGNAVFVGRGYVDPTGTNNGKMRSLYEVKHTNRIYLVVDCYFWYPQSIGHLNITLNGAGPLQTQAKPRHRQEGLNYTFVDGHGQFLRESEWHPGFADMWWPMKFWNYGKLWGE